MPIFSAPAIKCSQNGKQFYMTSITSDVLKTICIVSRKKEDPQKGFQRLLNRNRAMDIAFYLDEGKGVIPSSIILSAQEKAKVKFDEKTNMISFEIKEESMMVLDGQHRLYGLENAKKVYEFPVVIFTKLSSSDEVRLFIDINTTQKGVPMALILDIKAQAGTETKLEERQRRLFDELNKDSVLAGYLLPNESRAGMISRKIFNDSTKAIYESGPVADHGDKVIFGTLKNYLEAVDYLFKQTENPQARINKTVIFRAIMLLFNEVCEKCLIKYRDVKVESFIDYLQPIKQLNFEQYIGTNNVTVNKIADDIRNLLKEKVVISEDMF